MGMFKGRSAQPLMSAPAHACRANFDAAWTAAYSIAGPANNADALALKVLCSGWPNSSAIPSGEWAAGAVGLGEPCHSASEWVRAC